MLPVDLVLWLKLRDIELVQIFRIMSQSNSSGFKFIDNQKSIYHHSEYHLRIENATKKKSMISYEREHISLLTLICNFLNSLFVTIIQKLILVPPLDATFFTFPGSGGGGYNITAYQIVEIFCINRRHERIWLKH